MSNSKEHKFGGEWTDQKLAIVSKYLQAYRKIFDTNERARHFTTVYVDAFAGSGSFTPSSPAAASVEESAERRIVIDGSTRIALGHSPGFDKYLFLELNRDNAESLESLRLDFPVHSQKIEIKRGDSNELLAQFCNATDWKQTRAVVFLDPYGMQVDWKVIEALGATKAVDLWYLFPIGAMNRLLTREGKPPDSWKSRLNKILGTGEWESEFYKPLAQQDLFSEEVVQGKSANWESLSRFVTNRLDSKFAATVPPMLLRNSHNTPIFMLCFAAANEKGAKTAAKIASDLLKER